MKTLWASLSLRQRITIALVATAALAGIVALVHWNKERDFRPLYSGLSPEDAGAIVQKLKEGGIEYRLPEGGGSVLVPTGRLAELRLSMASAGLPKSGRIGFELFDKTSFGATEFTEHVNYGRALEGELERSIMALAEVEQARVHLTFSKESVFLEAQQPAKASVLVRLRPGGRLTPANVLAVNHLVASAVEGLAPERVAVLDMNGNLLSRPRAGGPPDGSEPSEASLDYRQKVESVILAKVSSTLEPLLGPGKFRAGVSVECDFTGGDQSEEIFDPAHTVMTSQERTEDATGSVVASGVPGAASNLPRPTTRPGAANGGLKRVTENITFQTSRTVKRTRLPQGVVKRMSLSVLVDHGLRWDWDSKGGAKRVLTPPAPETLKAVKDLVAAATGLNPERGDQLIVESLPFESTLSLPAPPPPGMAPPAAPAPPGWPALVAWFSGAGPSRLLVAAGAAVTLLLILVAMFLFWRRKGKTRRPGVSAAAALPAGAAGAAAIGPSAAEEELEAKLAERDALQQEMDSKLLSHLTLAPVISKTGEVLSKHLREMIKKEPEMTAHVLRAWIREEDL
jgi:flagellar M-ring protein FliF